MISSSAAWLVSDLGASTFNIGTIENGEKYNICRPPSAKALCEVRMVSDLAGVKAQVAGIVARHLDVISPQLLY